MTSFINLSHKFCFDNYYHKKDAEICENVEIMYVAYLQMVLGYSIEPQIQHVTYGSNGKILYRHVLSQEIISGVLQINFFFYCTKKFRFLY